MENNESSNQIITLSLQLFSNHKNVGLCHTKFNYSFLYSIAMCLSQKTKNFITVTISDKKKITIKYWERS